MKVLHIAAKTVSLFVAVTALVSCSREFEAVPEAENVVEPIGFAEETLNVRVSEDLAARMEAVSDDSGKVDLEKMPRLRDEGIISMRRIFPPAGRFEGRTRKEGLHLWYRATFEDGSETTKACRSVPGGIEGIEYTEPVAHIRPAGGSITYASMTAWNSNGASFPFDDPMLPQQWNYCNRGNEPSAVAGCDINVFPVWENITSGSPDVVVAVVDGGIDFTHEDLSANMWHNPDRTGDEIYGYNFVTDSYEIHPTSHGTHVAGTIAAVNNNGKGVCGIAGGDASLGLGGVRLMSCQIFDDSSREEPSVENAIKWGADHGAVILQNSWNAESQELSRSVKDAIEYFIKYAGMDENGIQTGPMAGGAVFFSAGNDNSSMAYCEEPGVVNVASVGQNFLRAVYSNYGDWVELAAPGGDRHTGNTILSTLPGDSYGYMEGTSMACPHASGVAALILSIHKGKGYSCNDLKEAMLASTRTLEPFGQHAQLGGGLVDAFGAVTYGSAKGEAPSAPVLLHAESCGSNEARVRFAAAGTSDDITPYYIRIYYCDEPVLNTVGLPYAQLRIRSLTEEQEADAVIHGLGFGRSIHLAATALSIDGTESSLSNELTVTTGENHAPHIEALSPLCATIKSFESYEFRFRISDPDSHFVYCTTSEDFYGISIDSGNPAEPVVRVEGPLMKSGHFDMEFICTDAYGAADSLAYSIDILENQVPTVSSRMKDIVLNGLEQMQIDASEYFEDEDGETLVYSASSDNPDIAEAMVEDGILNLIPRKTGYCTMAVTAADARRATITQKFNLLVREDAGGFDLYPIPVTDILNVRTATDIQASVKVLNQAGARVREAEIEIGPFSPIMIDMKNLPGGIYTVIVSDGTVTLNKNVVKL